VVRWYDGSSSSTLASAYVSGTELTATIPAGDLGAAGEFLIWVVNPGGAASGAETFTVRAGP
jgi:hypothetical protein